MKLKMYLKEIILFVVAAVMLGCSSDSDGGDQIPQQTSLSVITIASNIQSAVLENSDTFEFTVTGNDGVNYTANATFNVNGNNQSNNSFTPSVSGEYEVYAEYNGLVSNMITLVAESGVNNINVFTEAVVRKNSAITFTAKNNLNEDVTSSSTFYVDGVSITGNVYTAPNTVGQKTVYAKHINAYGDEIQSPDVEFDVIAFTQKVLVEDYTGTWCGYCPRLAYSIEQLENQDDRIISVAIHDDNDMLFEHANAMESQFGITGFPTAKINRTMTWVENPAQITSQVGYDANLGLAINSSLSGGTISVNIKVGYDTNTSNNKLVAYLMEDGLIYPQVNYYNNDSSSPWYQTGNPISDFEHNNVARKSFTNIFGDILPNGLADTDYEISYSLQVPSAVQDTDQLEIVAFVVDSNGTVLNVQHAALGENKDFD